MAGPQVQRKRQQHAMQQRPASAYYASTTATSATTTNGLGSSASYAGLHALRQITNESELIYRGSNGNTLSAVGCGTTEPESNSTHSLPQRGSSGRLEVICDVSVTGSNICSIAGGNSTIPGPSDGLLLVPATMTPTTASTAVTPNSASTAASTLVKNRQAGPRQQRSVEIIVDATQSGSDIEQGQVRKSSRHRHRPLHRRLINYLRNLFQGNTTTHGKQI